MDTAVIAAIIGGIVALMGTFVSVWVARRQAQEEVQAQIRQLSLDVKRQVLVDLHGLHTSAELVRAWCWDALAKLPYVFSNHTDEQQKGLAALRESLAKPREGFMSSWAPLRNTLPEESQPAVLNLVYSARTKLAALDAELDLSVREALSRDNQRNHLDSLTTALTMLRENLLELIHVTTSIRLASLESSMTAEQARGG